MALRLPIDDVLDELRVQLATHTRVVLQAPPGAGKTTRVPPALLDQPWLGSGRIVMLEPRRLAARAAASFMARMLDEPVGRTVGYRVRLDTRVSVATRIEVVTEGVLTRMLQNDPALDGVGIIIFDEFHERSIHADTGLALSLQVQSLLRPELRVLVMSATLDIEPLRELLDGAPLVQSKGRTFPVETVFLGSPDRIVPGVASAVRRALRETDGDVLAFLPGTAEIRRTHELLEHDVANAGHVRVFPLYGDLTHEEQDRAVAPATAGSRKVVLATSIAETSLTIEGVRAVVDSGLARVPRFSPRTGMSRLATVRVSRASAEQRRGRAGRIAPGVCYRLWSEAEHAGLLEHHPPEILQADLTALVLELSQWGVHDPGALRWLDAPPAAAWANARALLTELNALDDDGRITDHGRDINAFGLHPRLAHMLLVAAGQGQAGLACDIVALLSDRDVLRATAGETDPDLRLRIPLLHGGAPPLHHTAHRGALHRARTESRHWRRRMHMTDAGPVDADRAGELLALAYPDRIARQTGRGRFMLRDGHGVTMDAAHPIAGEAWIVAAELGGAGRHARVFLAAPLEPAIIEALYSHQIVDDADVAWDEAAQAVRARVTRRLGALILDERPLRTVSREQITDALMAHVRRVGLSLLDWTDDAVRLRERLAFLHAQAPDEWPDVGEDALLERLDAWLAPFADGAATAAALRRIDVAQALASLLQWPQRAALDRLAPTHLEVPSGSRIAIDYSDPQQPVLAVKLQEMFGATETPRIADGRVPLMLHLLSPARRPVQVTRDLASFWRTAYFDVRRDLRGRYPKHPWPDDPLAALPTRRTRPR